MYKKLFTINYKNKKFLVLVDKYHRKTFLEILDDGKYNYLEYEDYKELNEIYNNFDYTIKYDKNSRQMSYHEKVRHKARLLTCEILLTGVLTGIGGAVGKWILDLDANEKRLVSISFQQLYKDTNSDRANIDSFYNNEIITREDVIDAINNNNKIDAHFKEIAIKVMDLNLELDPKLNLRIYYENIKNMSIFVEPWEVISKDNTTNRAGYFATTTKEIHLCEDYVANPQTVAHELTHAMHNLIDTSKKEILLINDSRGYSLEEAMTNRIIANEFGYLSSYSIQQKILSFLIDNVDEFNYHIYNEIGISGLIDELKNKYPDVDIDYIIDYIDTYTITNYNIDNSQILPFEDMEFVNELFSIAINNIDRDDVYTSFDTFMKMFNSYHIDFYNKYYSLYNSELVRRRFINREKYDFINNINSIAYFNNNFYLGNLDNTYVDYDGNILTINDNYLLFPIDDSIKKMMISDTARGINVNTRDYIGVIMSNKISSKEYRNIVKELENNEKNILVDDIFALVTKNIDLKNLYGTFDSLSKLLLYDDYLYSKYDIYLEKYNNILIQNGIISKEQMNQIMSIQGFIETNGVIYPYSNIDENFLYKPYGAIWIKQDNIGTEQNFLRFNNNFVFNCINNNGNYKNEFNDKYLSNYLLSIDGNFALVQYLFENPTDNIFSQDYLRQMGNDLNIFSKINCNTYSDGTIAFDMHDIPNMYVEIGDDANNNIGLMLFNQNELVYGTCNSFNGNTSKIPFDIYLKLSHLAVDESNVEDIISLNYLDNVYNYVLRYLIPNLDISLETNINYNENNDITYEYNMVHKFNKLMTTFVDGKEGYLRHIILYENSDGYLVVNFFDGEEMKLFNIRDPKYISLNEKEAYYETFDTCINYLDIKPNNGDEYKFSKQDVINIVNQYLDAVISNDKNQDLNNVIKR